MPRALTTVEELRAATGFVVITDVAKAPIAHRTGCASLVEANFVSKVIVHGARHGGYFQVDDLAAAAARWPGLRRHGCL